MGSDVNVAVVAGDKTMREEMTSMMTEVGCLVHSYSSAQKLRSDLRKHHKSSWAMFDVIMSDMMSASATSKSGEPELYGLAGQSPLLESDSDHSASVAGGGSTEGDYVPIVVLTSQD